MPDIQQSESSELNVLLLGAGKRVSFGRSIISAANEFGLEPRLYSYENSLFQPISDIGKVILGKSWRDEAVLDDLKKTVADFKIQLALGHVDPALPVLGELLTHLPKLGTSSSLDLITKCLSKEKFQELAESRGLNIIPRWDRKSFPMIVKPDMGSASKGVELIYSSEQLREHENRTGVEVIHQTYIEGDEFTVDAYVGRTGELHGISPRKRIAVCGGEVTESMTVLDEGLLQASRFVIEVLALRGPMSIQFIKCRTTRDYFLLEVNTRFGGGVVNSIAAGVNFPRIVIQDQLGIASGCEEVKREVKMKRFFSEVFE